MDIGSLTPERATGAFALDRNAQGGAIAMGGVAYERGLGVAGPSELVYAVPAGHKRFMAWGGIDDEEDGGRVRLTVLADGKLVFDSGALTSQRRVGHMNRDRAACVSVPVTGVKELRLVVEGAGLADWAAARFVPDEEPAWPWPPPPPPSANALAPTPPMGLNTWNAFGTEINETLIEELADAMVTTGLRDAGYTFLNLDDGWQGDPERDEHGNPLAHTGRFPNGIGPLADAVHSLGLSLGIYTRPAWVGEHEQEAARAFAAWSVDYVKYDFSDVDAERVNRRMVEACGASGRPMVFNVCEWGFNNPWTWGAAIGAQAWRITFDVGDKWYTAVDCNKGLGLLKAADQTEALGGFAGPGRWNDPDMLVIGIHGSGHLKGGCRDVDYRTQMSLWALLAAPLLIGCDVRRMDDATRETLLNDEIIAIDQDPLGTPGWRVKKLDEHEVWMRPLAAGHLAVGLLNRGDQPATIAARWSDLDIADPHHVRDLWAKQDVGVVGDAVERAVAPHEMVMLRLAAQSD